MDDSTGTSVRPASWRVWLRAARPFSFTASMTPVLLGAALAFYREAAADWRLLAPVAAASLLIHAATNLVGEYFDYVKGVDRAETYGGSRVLVEGLLGPKAVLMGGLACFAATAVIGLLFIRLRGWPILALGVFGMLGGFFYSAMPVGYKYRGLGDGMVFLLMGPLMVIGSYYVLTGEFHYSAGLVSLPVGCLVAAILSANNLRDLPHDEAVHIRTTAGVLGLRRARAEYIALVVGAFVLTGGLIGLAQLPAWSAIVVLALPGAVKAIRAAKRFEGREPAAIATLDVETAQLHLIFGALLILSIVIEALL
jgi:1,4-dihydroxy-2-naphthoate octaprenyltransferase